MIAAAAVAAKFPPLQMLLFAELEIHWVNLGDNVHALHQAKAIKQRVIVVMQIVVLKIAPPVVVRHCLMSSSSFVGSPLNSQPKDLC